MPPDNDISITTIRHEKRLLMAIKLAQQGQEGKAREMLEAVLKHERNNELAWIWMAKLADSQSQQRKLLQHVLELNPQNECVEQAIMSTVGVVDKSAIDWEACSRAAKTEFRVEEHIDIRDSLIGVKKQPINKRRLAINTVLLALSAYFLLSVIFPSIRIMNLIYNILPQRGDADVTYVRLTQLSPILDDEISDLSDSEDEEEFATGLVPLHEVGVQAEAPNNTTKWLVEVTISHNSTQDAFVDGWDIVYPSGQVIVPRGFNQRHTYVAIRPREANSFTTQQTVAIRNNASTVTVRAHDSGGGYGGQEITINLETAEGEGYEIIRTE